MIKHVDPITAQLWLDSNEAVMIDVREPAEHAAVHIEGSTLLPLDSLHVSKLPMFEGKKIIVHCMLGKRGSRACEILQASQGDLDVYNLQGGITAWENAGLKVVKG